MIASEINHVIQILDILVHGCLLAFPLGRAIRCIFFVLSGQKKDAAAIPNAALDLP